MLNGADLFTSPTIECESFADKQFTVGPPLQRDTWLKCCKMRRNLNGVNWEIDATCERLDDSSISIVAVWFARWRHSRQQSTLTLNHFPREICWTYQSDYREINCFLLMSSIDKTAVLTTRNRRQLTRIQPAMFQWLSVQLTHSKTHI